MKRFMAVAATLMICGAAYSQTVEVKYPAYENYVQVQGTADREIVPDEIYVRIIISENDTKGKTSVEKLEQDMIAALRRIGVDVDKDLKVGDMSSEAYRKTFGKNTGRTTATYQLKVGGAQMLGQVYQALGDQGIYNLAITKLDHSRIKEITNEVRIEAVQNARTVASDMASALGQQIGRAVYIVDYNVTAVNARSNYMMADTAEYSVMVAGAAGSSSLDFRNIKLSYSVTVKFVLE